MKAKYWNKQLKVWQDWEDSDYYLESKNLKKSSKHAIMGTANKAT